MVDPEPCKELKEGDYPVLTFINLGVYGGSCEIARSCDLCVCAVPCISFMEEDMKG